MGEDLSGEWVGDLDSTMGAICSGVIICADLVNRL